jgi:hypothetical protein
VFERVAAAVPAILPCSVVATFHRDPATGDFDLLHQRGVEPRRAASARSVPAAVGAAFISSMDEPFVLTREIAQQVPPEYWLAEEATEVLVAPMRWEPDAFGAVDVLAPTPRTASPSARSRSPTASRTSRPRPGKCPARE